jgi:hypothetical protein
MRTYDFWVSLQDEYCANFLYLERTLSNGPVLEYDDVPLSSTELLTSGLISILRSCDLASFALTTYTQNSLVALTE